MFGDWFTEVDGSSHWLHEGSATYYCPPAEKSFWKRILLLEINESAIELQDLSKKEMGESLLTEKLESYF